MTNNNNKKDEFVSLYVKHETALKSYILSLVGNWSDADEVMQEVSMIIWRKFDQLTDSYKFMRWACSVARFQAYNFRRKKMRNKFVFSPDLLDTLAEEGVECMENTLAEHQALNHCLERLKRDDRKLLRDRYTGSTVQEIARQSDRSANALYKSIRRLRALLLQCITRRLKQAGAAE